jgi:S1-C subfamily serine protease
MLVAVPLARADDTAQQMRDALDQQRASLVRIEATTFVEVERVPGLTKGTRRSHRISSPGLVVDGQGLVVFPTKALDPASDVFELLGSAAQADVLDIDVVGADGRVREAIWLGRAPGTGLAFARVTESGRGDLKPVAWSQAVPQVGDALLVVSLGPAALGRPAAVEQARVSFRTEALLGITPRLPHALGGLVLAGGKPVGMLGNPASKPSGDLLRPDLLAHSRAGYLVPAATLAPTLADPPRETPTAKSARTRAWLGARTTQVTEELASERGLTIDVGVLVLEVYEGGPAAKAGLKVNDVLLDMDGLPLDLDPGERFEDLILDYDAGEVIPFKLQRGNAAQAVEITLEEGPVTPSRAQRANVAELGLLLRALTFFDRKELGLAADTPGVVVVELSSDGAASRAGLRPGDVLLTIEDKAVGGLQDVRERLAAEGTHPVKLRRRGQELTLRIRR